MHYDGTWVMRLTAGPPGQAAEFGQSARSGRRRQPRPSASHAPRGASTAYGRPLTFRLSPLSGDALSTYLDSEGWSSFAESLVMRLARTDAPLDEAIDQIPLKDIGRFIDAALAVHGSDPALRPGLSEIIGAIEPEAGLFVLEERRQGRWRAPICVHDGDLAGLFEIATDAGERAQGPCAAARAVGAEMGAAARRAARLAAGRGRQRARRWRSTRSLGFDEIYRYHYRQPPGA